MNLPQPEIPILESFPEGADQAAIFPNGMLTLTYWDLWSLISAKHCYASDLSALRKSLVDRRLNRFHHSMSRLHQIEDLIALVEDLGPRINHVGSVDDILSVIPERLLKKETQKGIKNITDDWGGYYPPSDPMRRSPRRLLEKEAMRGMWPRLPFDPTPIADTIRPLFIPKKKPGYFPKGTTSALSRRIDKAVAKELSSSKEAVLNHRALRYAVHRAALTLFHEEHHWDDSYGNMGELGKTWINDLLSVNADDLCLDPRIFLKDLLMFLCWEDYGLSNDDRTAAYIHRLPEEEQTIAFEILVDIQARASQGFQEYKARSATRILERSGVGSRSAPALKLLTQVAPE